MEKICMSKKKSSWCQRSKNCPYDNKFVEAVADFIGWRLQASCTNDVLWWRMIWWEVVLQRRWQANSRVKDTRMCIVMITATIHSEECFAVVTNGRQHCQLQKYNGCFCILMFQDLASMTHW